MKKFISHIWSLRREFVKYFIIGFSGLVLDVGSLYIFKEYFRLRPVVAVIINQVFLLNYIFFLNKYWAFKAKGVTHSQMIRFYTVAGMNYLISVGWMYLFNERLQFQYLLVRLVNIALSVT